jgi:sodium ion-translocating decarboxylase beta subunit
MLPYFIGNAIMIGIGCLLLYLAVKKEYEPLLLLPIGFGAVLVNLPFSGLMENGGILRVIYDLGIANDLFPILIFIGIGAMCDFGPLLERPWVMLFSIPAHMGIFIALSLALLMGFTQPEASSIGIIGAMDGPTAIFVTSKYAPHLLGRVTVCAYSYMATIPIIQIPLSKLLTTRKERLIRMEYKPRTYPRYVPMLFPIVVTLITGLIVPASVPLMGALMFGNLLKESGVVDRLSGSAQNEISNISTLLLGIAIGGTMMADQFLTFETLLIFALGMVAFVSALTLGIMFGKIACVLTKGKINPLIGATAISAFPMAARTAHMIARQEDPDNWLLAQAIPVNVGGQIASVIAGGVVITFTALLV